MNSIGLAFAGAAETLIGAPFRLHGRDPATGLDCVGLVASALDAIGRVHSAPRAYALRNLSHEPFLPALKSAGFSACEEPLRAGDLLLANPSAGQVHLAIAAKNPGFIHAHASLGRVVHTPPPLNWPILGRWRLHND